MDAPRSSIAAAVGWLRGLIGVLALGLVLVLVYRPSSCSACRAGSKYLGGYGWHANCAARPASAQ